MDRFNQLWREGDVIQIDPASSEVFGELFLVVTEVKNFGAVGYIQGMEGKYYYRLSYEHGVRIGQAKWKDQ